eukprot:gene11571-15494_t
MSSGWYPGKYVTKAVKRTTHNTSSSSATGSVDRKLTPNYSSSKNSQKGGAISPENSSKIDVNEPMDARAGNVSKDDYEEAMQFQSEAIQGHVSISMHQIKYLNMSNPSMSIEVEGESCAIDLSDLPAVYTLPIRQITSDIIIILTGKINPTIFGHNPVENELEPQHALIIIPLIECLAFTGKVLLKPPQWRMFFPAYSNQTKLRNQVNGKFNSGFAELSGYALSRFKQPLGFLQLEIELVLQPGPSALQCYFNGFTTHRLHQIENVFAPTTSEKDAVLADSQEDIPDTLAIAIFNRNYNRLKRAISFPTIMAYLLSFPEVFALIAVIGFIMLSIRAWQTPLLIYFVTLINGILTSMSRNYSNVIVWNESLTIPYVQSDDRNSKLSNVTNINQGLSTKKTLLSMASTLHSISSTLEIYDVLYVIFSILLLFASASFFITELIHFVLKDHKNIRSPHIKWMVDISILLLNFLFNVPDEEELIHRYIARTSIVKESGAEMTDACAEFAKREQA